MARTYTSALVTGATSGIGEAFAVALPPQTGLLLTGRNEEKLGTLQQRLARDGRTVEVLAADLRDPAARGRLIECSTAAGVDLFVNNAGLGIFGRLVDNAAEAEADMVAVNVVAVHALTRAILPGMVERARQNRIRAGLIVVSSTVGHLPVPYFATYAASKAFDLSLAEALAEEMADEPVDILALCPGATRTAFQERSGAPERLFGRAEPAEAVVRKALDALGRQRVLLSQPPMRLAFLHNVISHRLGAAGSKALLRRLMRDGD